MKNICLSGGCKGADTIFGEQAELAGHKVVHWSFTGHYSKCGNLHQLSTQQLIEADEHLKDANTILNRHYPSRFIYTNNLLRRNYYQIKTTERIYAVSSLLENGIVKGGTGWAVAMGILRVIPEIYFYDQEACRWYCWQGTKDDPWTWVEPKSYIPKPHGIYTGIGTSELNEAGKQSIIDLYRDK